MKMFRKAQTLARLLSGADATRIKRGAAKTFAEIKLKIAGDVAFVHRKDGFPAVCHPDWPESRSQFMAQSVDAFEFRLIRSWLQRNDWFLDIGANKGLFSFAALEAIGKQSGGVVAVEADEFACGKFALSMRHLGVRNATCVHAALGADEEFVTFYVSQDHAASEMQSLKPTEGALQQGLKEVRVPGANLQRIAKEHFSEEPPSMVKMDIEGAEVAALKSVPVSWLGEDGPLWLVEVNPDCLPKFGASAAELCGLFPEESFARWLMPKHPRQATATPSLRPLVAGENFADSWYYNLVAVPRGERWLARRRRLEQVLRV